MNKTKIEWATAVWNPVTGCTKVSEGCRNCYAEGIANRFWGERKFTDVQCYPERLSQPEKWKKGQRIFVNSMSDLFHESVDYRFIELVFDRMIANPLHTFIILTKRPARMRYFMNMMYDEPPRNVWLGVSAENQHVAEERIPVLLDTLAHKRIVSCEPLLGPVNFTVKHGHYETNYLAGYMTTAAEPNHFRGIDWVICGGESGTRARPMHPDWVRSLRDQCQEAGVPFFFKQWGTWGDSIKHLVYGFDHGSVKYLNPDGSFGTQKDWYYGNAVAIAPDGKRANGRKLDGREWNEFPEVEE